VIHLVHLATVPPQPWRNGGGTTRELLAWPQADAWQARVSVARIDSDGPFSAWPGVQRWFVVLEGAGVELAWEGRVVHIQRHSAPLHFDGTDPPGCRLPDGPTEDLNLMLRGTGGGVEAAQAAVPWQPAARWRAVFTATACTLHAGGRHSLAAGTLAWCDTAQAQPWHIESSPAPLRAWWLHAA
jgi:uncharacterized protein